MALFLSHWDQIPLFFTPQVHSMLKCNQEQLLQHVSVAANINNFTECWNFFACRSSEKFVQSGISDEGGDVTDENGASIVFLLLFHIENEKVFNTFLISLFKSYFIILYDNKFLFFSLWKYGKKYVKLLRLFCFFNFVSVFLLLRFVSPFRFTLSSALTHWCHFIQ